MLKLGRGQRARTPKFGFNCVKDDNHLQLTPEQNFTNWWNLYRASGGNNGFITWDYEQLDRILPAE
jgi:hypothetical protein